MENIILIGMPGCGKSTVGVVLAKTLGFDFADTDLLICRHEGMTLQRIIEEKGLKYFVDVECRVGKELSVHNTVVATGGSMVLYPCAMQALKAMGKVVFIDVDLPELTRRITNITTRGITFKEGETLESIYKSRRPYYEQYADITVNICEDSIENTVEKIIGILEDQK